MTATIDRILDTVQQINDGRHESLSPGMPFTIPESWGVGEAGAQGDLIFVIADQVPDDYKRIQNPIAKDLQLVPGNTKGSRHCLDSFDGVTLYRPRDWSEEGLKGPHIIVTKERVVTHPTHGHWTIPAGRQITFEYPRVWDAEQQRERRNAD